MPDMRGALDDLAEIRGQLARSSRFEGLGPGALSLTGILALLVAATQGLWLREPQAHTALFIAEWYATAAASIMIIGLDALVRSRRLHGTMAMPLMQQAARHFCPALVAGGLLTIALLRADENAGWMLPGLWQILFSFGAFAVAPMLPRLIFVVGVWYLLCGLICIRLGPAEPLSGWMMGIPFGIGQLMVAAILRSRSPADENL